MFLQIPKLKALDHIDRMEDATYLAASVWGKQDVASRIRNTYERVLRDIPDEVVSDYERTKRNIENNQTLSRDQKLEALDKLKERYGRR